MDGAAKGPICISNLCPERHHHAEWGPSIVSPAYFTPKIVSGSASISEGVMMLRSRNRAGKEACQPPRGPGKSKEVPGAWVGDTVTPNWLWALQRGEGRSIKNDHVEGCQASRAMFYNSMGCGCRWYTHFTDEIEAWKSYVIAPESHSLEVPELRFKTKSI